MKVEKEIFLNAFPASVAAEVNSLLDKLPRGFELKTNGCFQINLDGQTMSIPFRIYGDEPVQPNLTIKEALLLDCIFTRHHNGYIREKRLIKIINAGDYVATPFIAQLLGEYVVEILTVIRGNMSSALIENLIKFKKENPVFFKLTEQRIQSYWNCYYRTSKQHYPGFQILEAIKNKEQQMNKNL